MTKIFVAAHALIYQGDEFLITRRAGGRNYMPHKWDLPGGTVEAGESPTEALIREISEETQIEVKLGTLLYAYNNMAQFPARQTFQLIYSARFISGDIVLNPREHEAYAWITERELGGYDCINFIQAYFSEVQSDL